MRPHPWLLPALMSATLLACTSGPADLPPLGTSLTVTYPGGRQLTVTGDTASFYGPAPVTGSPVRAAVQRGLPPHLLDTFPASFLQVAAPIPAFEDSVNPAPQGLELDLSLVHRDLAHRLAWRDFPLGLPFTDLLEDDRLFIHGGNAHRYADSGTVRIVTVGDRQLRVTIDARIADDQDQPVYRIHAVVMAVEETYPSPFLRRPD